MTDQRAIDGAEHRSGLRPLGEYPDHCARCKKIHDCDHSSTGAVRTLDGRTLASWCIDCGLPMCNG